MSLIRKNELKDVGLVNELFIDLMLKNNTKNGKKFKDFDLSTFWEESAYAKDEYI